MDCGAGKGIPMGAAMALGASRVYGFELPENKANKIIFEAAINRNHLSDGIKELLY